jgi:type IV pilus assembly protein PilY1
LSDNAITYETMDDPDGGGENPDLSDTVPNNAGWYFDLPITKERMVRDLLIRSGKLIFISTIPSSTACSAGGESILHESNACTGGRLNTPQLDINNDGVIDESDLINIGGEWVAPTGMYYPTMLYPPSIVPAGEDEIKLMSTSSGQIIDIRETSERAGIIYWQQLDQ